MSSFPDPIEAGLKRGWTVIDATAKSLPSQLECDVVIIGTGAGGGISAEILANAGLKLILIEEGPLKSSKDFNMLESEAYPQLYQESAARKTKDKAINILQGRSVGGSTTVNWTSSFRTPTPTLSYWADQYGLNTFTPELLSPWFAKAETRLSVAPWAVPPNENNDLLRKGAAKLGIPAAAIQRNVKGCMNLGYCGMGCPANAKQSMLITTIPSAMDRGAQLLTRARAQQLIIENNKVVGVQVQWLDDQGLKPRGQQTIIRARHTILSGGAINTPAVLLRSLAPDPNQLVGKRTFLHPTVLSAGTFAQEVNGFDGAPQTIYSDHFLETQAIDGPIGFKLEAPPIHPLLYASVLHGFGKEHVSRMKTLKHTHSIIALMRDGFHSQAQGGSVHLRGDGSPELDYPLTDFVMDGAKRALLVMAQIQFEAGAQKVFPVHELATGYQTWAAAKSAIENLPMKPLLTRVVSAHVMGGAAMASTPAKGITRPDGRHFHLENLSIHDGSIFPTSIGANPQLSIYGIVNRMASELANQLTGSKQAGLLRPDQLGTRKA
jgi:choline dehydrogenase-like flavoprotein